MNDLISAYTSNNIYVYRINSLIGWTINLVRCVRDESNTDTEGIDFNAIMLLSFCSATDTTS